MESQFKGRLNNVIAIENEKTPQNFRPIHGESFFQNKTERADKALVKTVQDLPGKIKKAITAELKKQFKESGLIYNNQTIKSILEDCRGQTSFLQQDLEKTNVYTNGFMAPEESAK